MRDCQDVCIASGGGVGAGAFQQDQVFATRFAGSTNGIDQLGDAGHASRNDHRFASAGHTTDQGQVCLLERGYLVARHMRAFQQINSN